MVKVPELGFNGKKLKPLLNQSIIRIQMVRQKRSANIQQQMKMVARLLGEGQIEKARLNTERIIKTDWFVEALELLELYCETVRDNAQAIASEKLCPIDLEESVITLIYCAHRTEIKELNAVVKQFKMKYGKEFVNISQNNRGGVVNDRIVHKLSGERPNAFLVVSYMKEIADKFGVDWTPDEIDEELGERFDTAMVTPSGNGVTAHKGAASGLGGGAYAYTDGRIMQPGFKPSGYVPKPKVDAIIPTETRKNDDDDDDEQGGGGGGGQLTEIPTAQPVTQKEEDGVEGHAVRGNEQVPKQRVQLVQKQPPKKEKNDLDDLAARFEKLKQM